MAASLAGGGRAAHGRHAGPSKSRLRSPILSRQHGRPAMIKVMWFLKRAEHLSLEEFHRWWIETHVPAIVAAQKPHLRKYVVDLRWAEDPLPGKPKDEMDWDGVAEQWFETEDDFKAVYGWT